MGQVPRQLAPHQSPQHFFGAELRHWRQLRGLSQDQLGLLVLASGDTIGKVEKAVRWASEDFAKRCDAALETGGALARMWPLVEAQRGRQGVHADNGAVDADSPPAAAPPAAGEETIALRVDEEGNVWARTDRRTLLMGSTAAVVSQLLPSLNNTMPASVAASFDDPYGFGRALTTSWLATRISRPVPDYGVDWAIHLPGGRAMGGTELCAQVHGARLVSGRVVSALADPVRGEDFLRGSGRRLLVGATTAEDMNRYFLLETLDLRQQPQSVSRRGEFRMPAAYELDDLTYGVLWAVANIDDALQADDQPLAETRADLSAYERLGASAVSREAAPGLNPVGHMWLGSDFCARHILRSLPELPSVPTFWTREQRGEEASTWLLFDHKYAYLRQTMDLIGSPVVRAFCVPEDAVRQSPRYERVLLFLAIALMESLGIHVQLTSDPEYGNVEGFVIAPSRQAVIANWVRGDGMWHVDTTSRAAVVRNLTNVAADVASASIIEGPTPAARLRTLASYLGLDWSWLTSRCAALGRVGAAGMIRPRSRLVSTAGLDSACAFVGSLPASQ